MKVDIVKEASRGMENAMESYRRRNEVLQSIHRQINDALLKSEALEMLINEETKI